MNYPNTLLYIDGVWREASDARSFAVSNPASGQAIGRAAHATAQDTEDAVRAADCGFRVWRRTPAAERCQIMRKAAGLLRDRAEDIAFNMTLEQGKPLAESRTETFAAADTIEWFADEGMRVYGRVIPARNSLARQLVLKHPVGPVAAFTPWNFPINQAVRKISAALTTGCSMVLKGPQETPASLAGLVAAFGDAGLPSGVLNLLYGNSRDISSHLISHPLIRKVTFTGSTPVGKQLAEIAGRHMKRVTMELGGHAPVIIAEDADVELAVRASMAAKFRNAGQVCVSPTRFLVHESIVREFSEAAARAANALKVGNGMNADTQMGPLVNARRVEAMAELTQDAIASGARVIAGGDGGTDVGSFWRPTVLANVPRSAKVFNDEPFGPIVAVSSFDTLDDAVAEANRLPFGLAGYAFTRSLSTAHRLSEDVEVGLLWINQPATPWPEVPFGGLKDSGYGSEGGPEALEGYLSTRAVSITNV